MKRGNGVVQKGDVELVVPDSHLKDGFSQVDLELDESRVEDVAEVSQVGSVNNRDVVDVLLYEQVAYLDREVGGSCCLDHQSQRGVAQDSFDLGCQVRRHNAQDCVFEELRSIHSQDILVACGVVDSFLEGSGELVH